MNNITIYDVAKRAGCSTATVSLTLRDSPRVKLETKKRIRTIMEELGYTPSFSAQSLSTNSTNTIGLIIPNIENPVFSQMIAGVEEYSNEEGYNLILGISNLNLEKEKFYLNMLLQKRVDGLIVFPTFIDSIISDYINNKNNIPTVFCGSSGKSTGDFDFVKCDNEQGAFLATEHLINQGRKKIGFIAAISSITQASSRISGYTKALNKYELEFDENLIKYCDQNNESVYNASLELFSTKDVDGVFCLYDYMALSVIRAALSTSRKIPEDISVIGFDNIEMSKYLPVPLSSINTHSKEIGYLSAQILIDKIKQPSFERKQLILQPELIVRESSAFSLNSSIRNSSQPNLINA